MFLKGTIKISVYLKMTQYEIYDIFVKAVRFMFSY